MTPATLFGIALAPLYAAIATVESDRGATDKNIYQIRRIYIDDVNRIVAPLGIKFDYGDVYSQQKSEEMMYYFWQYYGKSYQLETGKAPTASILARMHNGGPRGWMKNCTKGYWNRVLAALVQIQKEDAK